MTSIELPADSITTATHEGHTLTLAMVEQLDQAKLKDIQALCRITIDGKPWILGTHNKAGTLRRVSFKIPRHPGLLDDEVDHPIVLCKMAPTINYDGERCGVGVFEGRTVVFYKGAYVHCDFNHAAEQCLTMWNGQEDQIRAVIEEHHEIHKLSYAAARLPLVILH